ncbi:MAG: diguanylate cyclase [Nitrosomonadales bacterium]|nr:diguanylate cyclase [Nitrosomonadales bacterium]
MTELRLLLLEDNPNDAELLEYKLRTAGLSFVAQRVDTEPAFKQALADFKPDLILSDYNLPTYSGSAALGYIQQNYPDLPIIMVTGAIGEEKAIELLQAGAKDYLLKDRLTRLPAAIQRVLREREEIMARRESDKRLREAENKFHTLFETANDGILLQDATCFVDCNQQAACMYGVAKEKIIGHSPVEFSPERQADGKLSADVSTEKIQAAMAGVSQHFEWRALRADGQPFDVDISLNRIEFGGAVYLQTIMRDITERKLAEEQIRNFAFYDSLTQLPNRRLLNDRLQQTMLVSKRNNHYGALMFLDLDNFKPLNDAHGHDAGDLLLIEVARRITSCVREVDTVARFGGDEFVVMLSDLHIDKTASLTKTSTIAEKIRSSLSEPYVLTLQKDNEEKTVVHRCTSSIGVALFINHEASPEELIKRADRAMYQAKNGGRNAIHFFDSATGTSQATRRAHG